MKNPFFIKSYIGLSVLYLLVVFLGQEQVAWFIKPFLILFLMLAVFFYGNFPSKKFLLTALTFSWIGDVILLFAHRNKIYFISGLIAFLISHAAYIITFNKQLKIRNRKSKAVFWIGVTVIIVYLMTMLAILLPSLGDLKIPVFVYALVISTMLLFAFKGFLVWEEPANWYILLGAIIFVSSDSILAFDKFYIGASITQASFLIMLTYLGAQYLIVKGILRLNQKK
jgi:uncharacterized membrane protein YhhN